MNNGNVCILQAMVAINEQEGGGRTSVLIEAPGEVSSNKQKREQFIINE